MHRCVMGVAILLVAAFCPAIGQARSAMECIQHSEYKFRNLCSKNVVVAWCITNPKEGYNTSQGIVCGEGSSYYGWVQNFPKGASTTSFGWLGGLRWAACFSPKTPVATRGGERFVCRDRRGAGEASPVPARPAPSGMTRDEIIDEAFSLYNDDCVQGALDNFSRYPEKMRPLWVDLKLFRKEFRDMCEDW